MRHEVIIPIAQFLSRAWADKELRVSVSDKIENPHTGRNTIYMPPPTKFPSNDQVIAYRLWRESLWHEAMHHYGGTFKRVKDTFEEDSKLHFVLNCVEDYLIEMLGVQTYPGMRRELELSRAIYFKLAKKPEHILTEFAQLLLFGAVKDTKPQYEVHEAVDYVKKEIANGNRNTPKIAENVLKILKQNPIDYYGNENMKRYTSKNKVKKRDVKEAIKEWLEKVSKDECKDDDEEEGIDSGILSHLDDILNPGEEVKKELQKIKEEDKKAEERRQRGAVKISEESFTRIPIHIPTSSWADEERYYDMNLITRLRAQMRRIRKGFKETFDNMGEFDVDSYVLGKRKCFVNEQRLKVGGYKVIILLDHSGSIGGIDVQYKKASVTICEALSALGVDFAVYAFSDVYVKGGRAITKVHLIKEFSEKWSKINAKRLASIKATGGTPLGSVYDTLEPLVNMNKGNLIFITLTDGAPNNKEYTRRNIAHLKRKCRMVAIAFALAMDEVINLTEDLKSLGYDRCVALDDIRKLPNKILNLISE